MSSNQFLTNQCEITAWLDRHNVIHYTLNPDLSVKVRGHVKLDDRNLTYFPVRFHRVGRDFSCSHNQLESLVGAPYHVKKFFICIDNKITSLKGGPQFVGRTYNCDRNNLESLEFLPENAGNFFCDGNPQLGELQVISDFGKIKKLCAHYQIIKKEQKMLSNMLDLHVRASQNNKNSCYKI